MSKKRVWTAEEDAMLRALYPIGELEFLCTKMDRTAGAVGQRARCLGVRLNPDVLSQRRRLVAAAASEASIRCRFKPKHGKSGDAKRVGKAYASWLSMKQRCTYAGHKSYPLYGGRGIQVCERWALSFEAFMEDMGERPAGTSLDRIDLSKGYEPGNCRWATPREQAENRSTTVFLTAFGQRKSLPSLAREFGIRSDTLMYRIKRGEAVESALTRPVKRVVEHLHAGEVIRKRIGADGLVRWSVGKA